MKIIVTNDDGFGSPGIHALAAMVSRLGHEPVVVAPAQDMSGASAAIGRIELDRPTPVRRVQLPAPADDVEAYAVDGPPGMAALLAVRGGIDGLEPDYLFSGINIGTNTGHSILHSGTVGAALTAATFGLSGLAVSLAVSKPMAWEYAYAYVEEAMTLLEQAPRATVLNVNVPVPRPGSEPQKLALGRARPLRLVPGRRRRAARGGGAARVPGDGDRPRARSRLRHRTRGLRHRDHHRARGNPRGSTGRTAVRQATTRTGASARARAGQRSGRRLGGLISPSSRVRARALRRRDARPLRQRPHAPCAPRSRRPTPSARGREPRCGRP